MTDRPVYLTPEAREKLEEELNHLTKVTRVEIATRIAEAKELGDLSENSEYHAARNEQSFVVGRIRELEHILHHAQEIPSQGVSRSGIVQIGSTITVRDEDGEEDTYRLRGSVEANPREHIISNESPIGKVLLGKKAGDKVTVQSPAGSYKLVIVKVD